MPHTSLEIEIRGLLTEQQFNDLSDYLSLHSDSYQSDNKISYFFVVPDRILKVVENLDTGVCELVLKVGDETKNVLQEYSIQIQKDDISGMVDILIHLGFDKVNRVEQKRINYNYKGTEIALKYTNDRGYHIEIEMMARGESEVEGCKTKVYEVADELGVSPMTPEQIADKIVEINTKHGI